ncbi:MAG TPA: RecQ family ATP-dependent DNA helicase, partial [Porphyromonadaceae bacterium]|nr:RecQ family ATP-dependent DNA helicase [Porphyromonadaceae bacterium]
IASMADYAENERICRSRMLLIYFDEKNPKDCGSCDVCLRKTENGLTNYEFNKIETLLAESLEATSPQRLDNLLQSIPGFPAEKVIKVIRFLVDRGRLSLNDDEIALSVHRPG